MSEIGELLKKWMKESQAQQRVSSASMYGRWRAVVGEEIARHTRVVELRQGELVVEVNSPPLLHELSTYYGRDLIESLQQESEFRRVRSIRFRSGSFDGPIREGADP